MTLPGARSPAKCYTIAVRWVGAVIFLAGCSGVSLTPNRSIPSDIAFDRVSPALHAKQDLLYVTDDKSIDVYTYPRAGFVRSFTGTGSGNANGACVDSAGNVYVNYSNGPTVEYPHGDSKPVKSWNLHSSPVGCAVDPMTGNLAVANPVASSPYGGHGFIWVWNKATGKVHSYTSRKFRSPIWCGYNTVGDLFIEGYARDGGKTLLTLFELPRGAASLKRIAIGVTGGASGVQYDGRYLTIGADDKIYQLRVTDSKAKIVATTTLSWSGHQWNAQNYFVVTRGKSEGRRVVSTIGLVGFFKYPAGGEKTKLIRPHNAYAAVVSFAQK